MDVGPYHPLEGHDFGRGFHADVFADFAHQFSERFSNVDGGAVGGGDGGNRTEIKLKAILQVKEHKTVTMVLIRILKPVKKI
jgi:hypothetical protein